MLPLSGERIAHAGQLGLYGSIEHLVPDGHAHAADQRLVDGDEMCIRDRLAAEARRKAGDVHSMPPACVSITQATETGSVYTLDEIQAIGAVCRRCV